MLLEIITSLVNETIKNLSKSRKSKNPIKWVKFRKVKIFNKII